MTGYDVARNIHIAAGTAALGAFWIPAVTAKGGRLHRRAGAMFVWAMAVLCVTAVFLAIRGLGDPRPSVRNPAAFILFVSVLSGSATLKGVRVLRTKARTGPHRGALDLGAAGITLLGGLAVCLLGLASGVILFAAFGLLGVAQGAADLRYWLRAPQERMHWWYAHMGGMVGAGIAALTAFAVINASRLLPRASGPGLPSSSLVAWLLPSAIGVPALLLSIRHYRRRFEAAPAPDPRTA